MTTSVDDSGFSDEQIAEVAHNLVVSMQRVLGEAAMPFWHELAPDAWQREDTVRQVARLRRDPAATPKAEHEAWMQARTDEGWTYGQERDTERKRNPLLVPWEQLSFVQRARAEAGFALIRTLLGQR